MQGDSVEKKIALKLDSKSILLDIVKCGNGHYYPACFLCPKENALKGNAWCDGSCKLNDGNGLCERKGKCFFWLIWYPSISQSYIDVIVTHSDIHFEFQTNSKLVKVVPVPSPIRTTLLLFYLWRS